MIVMMMTGHHYDYQLFGSLVAPQDKIIDSTDNFEKNCDIDEHKDNRGMKDEVVHQ